MVARRLRPGQTNNLLTAFLSYTSSHGLVQINRSVNVSHRLWWSILTIAGLVIAVYQSYNLINNYLRYEFVSLRDIRFHPNVTFPQVTICNVNKFRDRRRELTPGAVSRGLSQQTSGRQTPQVGSGSGITFAAKHGADEDRERRGSGVQNSALQLQPHNGETGRVQKNSQHSYPELSGFHEQPRIRSHQSRREPSRKGHLGHIDPGWARGGHIPSSQSY
ncbi:hypothetical protein LSH36_32g01028 [Paralvinella palmiformis]|uniref:Uncharacterized protein n=1 Tax=Paralvinella palmiformis TaxID=53620 RepID=A0AAD9KAR2_9ANNE|nr:hypothetical protein LSH36_32g01028 [Paralvinella palmiformis]